MGFCLLNNIAIAAAHDPLAWDLRPAAVAQTGARILQLLVGVAAGDLASPAPGTFAERLARAWAPRQKNAASLIDAALIACADHELNVSAFTARCVASADAPPWQVVMAGLAALLGNKHGGTVGWVAHAIEQYALDTLIRPRARYVGVQPQA